jgi:hypothetical protein
MCIGRTKVPTSLDLRAQKVQILTPEALSQATSCAKGSSWCCQHVLGLLALLVPILTPEARADDELCDRIVVVLSKWIRSIESASPGQTFKTFETLKKALKLVFKGQEQMAECCQQVLKKKTRLTGTKVPILRRWPIAVRWCY